MAVKLYKRGFEYAKKLINEGRGTFDERDAWSEDQPSTQEENDFIRQYGIDELPNGIWPLMTSRTKAPNAGTSFRTVILKIFTAAPCFRRNAERVSTSTLT